MPTATPKGELLHPRDPSTDDSTDEWPELTLSDAYVHLPDDYTATTSLLEAAAGHPLTVVGYLEPLQDEDVELYRRQPPNGKAQRVLKQLDNVRMFSYGQLEDGRIRLWAAGKTAWYTINPSKKYRPIHKAMCDAVGVLYFVSDAYREERAEGRGKSKKVLPDYTLQELFEKYAREELESEDTGEARRIIESHKDFLISAMIAGKEGLHWSKYALYKYFYKQFPDAFALAKERQRALEPAKGRRRKGPIDASSNATKSDLAKPRRSRKGSVDTTTTASSRRKGEDTSQTDTRNARVRSTRQVSVEVGSNASGPTRRRGRNGPVEVISLDGSETSSATAETKGDTKTNDRKALDKPMAPPQSKPASRRTRQPVVPPSPVRAVIATPAKNKDEESDEEIRAREQKNKSSLRPRASKATKSASRRGTQAPNFDSDEGEDNDGDEAPPSSPMPGKRKHVDEAEECRRRIQKRRSSRPVDDEGIDIPTSPEAASSPEPLDLPLRPSEVGHQTDPVQEDTWVCALDGCTHKVYAASQSDSQRLIREHYALHAYDDDERVKMVKTLQAPSLPVAHLMERVKLQAKYEGFPASSAMPDQVRSRFGSAPQTGVVQRY